MEKSRKLDRYAHKEYDENVGFPVEIRSRDGGVRHYDFDASVRLYQRRLGHAIASGDDADLVAAEVGHCRARIAQLRRSFFVLQGWTSPEGLSGPEAHDPELAGEIAALLVRVLGGVGRPEITFARAECEGPEEIWCLARRGGPEGLLLHVFRTQGSGEKASRAAADALLRRLATVAPGAGEAELLLGHRDVGDAVLVVSGPAEEVALLAARTGELSTGPDAPWSEVVELARLGDLAAVWMRCRALAAEQPWHRDAYVVGAAAARLLGRAVDAEDLAFVGTRYLAHDALVRRELGAARLAQGRAGEAVVDLELARRLDPGLAVVVGDQLRAALPDLPQAPPGAPLEGDDDDARRVRGALELVARVRRRVRAVQGGLLLLGAGLVGLGAWGLADERLEVLLGAVLLGAGVTVLGLVAQRALVARVESDVRDRLEEDVAAVLRRVGARRAR